MGYSTVACISVWGEDYPYSEAKPGHNSAIHEPRTDRGKRKSASRGTKLLLPICFAKLPRMKNPFLGRLIDATPEYLPLRRM